MCHVVQVHLLAVQDAKHIYRTRVMTVVEYAQPRQVSQRTRNDGVKDMEVRKTIHSSFVAVSE